MKKDCLSDCWQFGQLGQFTCSGFIKDATLDLCYMLYHDNLDDEDPENLE